MTAGSLSSHAYFCVLQRTDGVGLGATSHDRAVTLGDITYDPAPGLAPSELTLSDDLFSSSLRFAGALSSEGLRTTDLMAGRWASASLLLSGGDWASDADPELLCRGRISSVRLRDGAIDGELDLLPQRSQEQPCPQTSPECRAQLGDRQCRVAMRGRTRRARVSAVDGLRVSFGLPDMERFGAGRLRWLSGENCGFDQAVMSTFEGGIILRERPPFAAAAGDRVLLVEGCDGRLQTCSERFGNVANFRGEPFLPGTDFVTRYPGG